MTLAERNRNYRVLMHGLMEERRVCRMSKEEFDRRHREIFDQCYSKVEVETGE